MIIYGWYTRPNPNSDPNPHPHPNPNPNPTPKPTPDRNPNHHKKNWKAGNGPSSTWKAGNGPSSTINLCLKKAFQRLLKASSKGLCNVVKCYKDLSVDFVALLLRPKNSEQPIYRFAFIHFWLPLCFFCLFRVWLNCLVYFDLGFYVKKHCRIYLWKGFWKANKSKVR